MKKITIINQKNIEEILLYLERGRKYKQYKNSTLLEVAFKFILFYEKIKDLRYLNLVLKIKDTIPKNILLNKKLSKLMNRIEKNKNRK